MSPPVARMLVPLWTVSFLASLGFSLVLPFLVFVVTARGGNAFVMGALGAAYSASQLVGAPWLGRLSDRVGRKRVLLISQLGGLGSWALFLVALLVPSVALVRVETAVTGAFTLTLPLLLIVLSRVTDGLVNGSISVANAYIADVTSDEDRKAAFGRLGAAWSLGFVLGPALAGFLARSERGVIVVVVLAALLSAAGAAVVAFLLPESPPPGAPPTGAAAAGGACAHKALGGGAKECVGRQPRSDGLRQLLALPRVPALLAVYFLVFLGFSVFTATFPVHALTELGWSSSRLGLFYTLLSVALIVTQSGLLPALGRLLDERLLASLGSLILAGGYGIMTAGGDRAAFLAAVLYGVGNGLMWPSYLALLSRTGSASVQGALQGVGSSAGSLAAIAGTLGGGLVFARAGHWSFLVPAGVLVLTAVVSLGLAPTIRRPASRSPRPSP